MAINEEMYAEEEAFAAYNKNKKGVTNRQLPQYSIYKLFLMRRY